MTRPKKDFMSLKMFQINIRVTLEEQLQIEEFSKSYGLSVTQYIINRSLKKQLPKQTMPSINRALFIELSRIGNNLNQSTKRLHQGNPNAKRLQIELLELKAILEEVKSVLLQ